jgi:hypothetical protein
VGGARGVRAAGFSLALPYLSPDLSSFINFITQENFITSR